MTALSGKTVVFLGDSITEGYGVDVGRCYVDRFAALSGADVVNCGISGTRIAPQNAGSPDSSWDRYFASRIEELPSKADIVVVFGGTNDFAHGDAPFGTPTDTTEATFCGAERVLMRRLRARYPAARIVAVTPLHLRIEGDPLNAFGLPHQSPLIGYVDAIVRIATEEGAEVFDAYRRLDMPAAKDDASEVWFVDGVHPNDRGHLVLAKAIFDYLTA